MSERFEYKNYGYRLNDETAERIKELKLTEGISYNQLFTKLIEHYETNR